MNDRYRNVVQVLLEQPETRDEYAVVLAVCADGTLWRGIRIGMDYDWTQLNGPPLTVKGPAKPVVRPDVLVGPKRDLSTLPPEALVPAEVPK